MHAYPRPTTTSRRRIMTGGEDAGRGAQTSAPSASSAKPDVIESTVSLSFEGIAAVVRAEQSPTQRLDAVLLADTPSHDLARNQITLRRRRCRRRLASEAAGHPTSAIEMRAPLSASGDAVPAAGMCAFAIAGDQPVQPAARIHSPRKPDPVRRRGRRAAATTTSPHGRPGIPRRWCSGTTALPNSSGVM